MSESSRGFSRRTLLRRAGVGGAALAASTALPAAATGAFASAAGAPTGSSTAEGVLQLARVWFTPDQEQLVAMFDDTHNAFEDGSIEILVWPESYERLVASGLRFEITVPDLIARDLALHSNDSGVSLVAPQPGERADYRHLADYEADLRKLATDYPDKCRLIELPHKTLEGRTVYGVEIASRVNEQDGRPVFYNDGCHHAREWPAAEVPIMWAYDLLTNYGVDPRITAIVDKTRNIVVPVVNVDGFEYSRRHPMTAAENSTTNTGVNQVFGIATKGSYWRKNKRAFVSRFVGAGAGRVEAVNREKGTDVDAYGVDPNRNYAYAWGDNLQGSASWQASDVYRGEKPLSEAESSNVASILRTNQVTTMISHHTSGNLVLWAWGDTTEDAPDDALLQAMGRGSAFHNKYTPQKNIQLYVTTGTCSDYGYGVYGSIGFTFEHAGSTFHPPYTSTVPAMYAKNRPALLLLAEEMCLLPADRPSLEVRALPEVMADQGYDPNGLNHAVITGRLVDTAGNGVQGTVTLRKRFNTLLWRDGSGANAANQKVLEEFVETTMTTAADGRFTYHVNPSTRPYLTAAGEQESYELVAKGAGKGCARDVFVPRAQITPLGDLRLA